MKRFLAALSLLAFAAAVPAQQKPPVDDTQFGLAKGSLTEAATPRAFEFKDDAKPLRPLEGSGMPVMIPHTVDDALPITLERNECLRCHTTTGKKFKGALPVPVSHVASTEGKGTVAGKRYQCLSCHAPQADVPALVSNSSR